MRSRHRQPAAHHSAPPVPHTSTAALAVAEQGVNAGAEHGADAKNKVVTAVPLRAPVSTLRRIAIPFLLTLVAVGILLYPVVVTQLHNLEQKRVAAQYSTRVQDSDPDLMAQSIQQAHQYNTTLKTGPILDPWLARISEDNKDYQEYLDQLSVYDVMARLIVPSANIDLPVYHGTAEDALQKGVGHLYGTSMPVGGKGTHAVLTGHSGLSSASLFDHLRDVTVGDPIYLAVGGERMKY